MINALLRSLKSLRFTIFLIVSLGTLFILGLWIPQRGVLQADLYLKWRAQSPALVSFLDTLGLTSIYTSPLLLTLWGLFFVNLALVMWQRLPLVARRMAFSDRLLEEPEGAPGYAAKASLAVPSSLAADLPHFLRRRGFRFHGTPQRFYAVKNRRSPAATILFHLSFFLILLGGLISIYSRFVGQIDLAEGESFHGEVDRYSPQAAPPKLGSVPEADVTVLSIVPQVENSMPTGLLVKLKDGAGVVHRVDINRPYKTGHTSFVIKDLGVAPLFVLTDPAGREEDGAFVKLNVLKGKRDSFLMGGYRFQASFYPDYAVRDGVEETASEEFRNPALHLVADRDGRKVAEKTLLPNGFLELDGHRLVLRQVPFYARFLVVKEYGVEVIYAGFAIATVALIWRLLFYRRELIGAFREEGETLLQLAYRSEFYKALAEEELEALVAALERHRAGGGETA